MALNTEEKQKKVHVAVFPPAGMGPTFPFLHFARTLALRHNVSVTFITTETNVNPWETAHAHSLAVSALDIRLLKLPVERQDEDEDPFFAHWDATRKSMAAFEKLLTTDLLQHSSRPPISAIFTDPLLSTTLEITSKYHVPNYFLCPVSAFCMGLMAYLPILHSKGFDITDQQHKDSSLQIPGFPLLTSTEIPGFFKLKDNIFRRVFLSSGADLNKAAGILINTMEELEPQCLQALRSGEVATGLPPVHAIGPLFLHDPWTLESTSDEVLRWMDAQPARSVVFVSFGSRAAMSADEIKELALGLESSQQRFLWRVRTAVIEDDSSDGEVERVLPAGFMERVKGRGVVVTSWVAQTRILSHPSTGVFVSHCGWNSTLESISCGVPFVAWPLFGDQMMNGKVAVEMAKVGVAVRRRESDGVVAREEVQRAVEAAMAEELRTNASKFKQYAQNATSVCDSRLHQIIQSWK